MKTIKYLLYAIIAPFVFAGCSDDPTYTPGEGEDPNSYGVYFPSQENASDLELDPADPMKLTFKVQRASDKDDITVPVEVSGDIFTVSEIKFDVGQTEAEFSVSFDEAKVGVTYACNIRVVDKRYASIYGNKSTGLDFSITRVKWDLVTGPNGETKGKWRDDILVCAYGIPNGYAESEVEIYQRADRSGYYRIVDLYSPDYVGTLIGESASDIAGNCAGGTIYIDATKPEKVWLPQQTTGVTLNSGDGVIDFASKVPENGFTGTGVYGVNTDGIITFPAKSVLLAIGGEGWYTGNSSGMLRIMLPGAKDYDYSVVLSKSEPADGKTKLSVKLGADVAAMKYAIFEGSLSTTLATAKSNDMAAGVIPTKDITEKKSVLSVEMEKTGIYTIVGNIYNAAGVIKGIKYMSFGYIKAGEEKPVVLSLGMNITDKYAPEGFTSKNSVEVYAYGEQIQSASYGLFVRKTIVGQDLAALIKAYGKPFSAAALAELNSNGFSAVFGNLNEGTEYTFIVSANNGYITKTFSATASTKGVSHPLNDNYTVGDMLDVQPAKAEYSKTWNYYAVDAFAKPANPNRVKIGSVTIVDNTTDDVVADPSKEVDAVDFMNITGLSGLTKAELGGKDDTMLIEYVDGLLCTYSNQKIGKFKNTYYISNLMTTTYDDNVYSANWALLGCMVKDGYIAFVANPEFFEEEITFDGMFFAAYEDEAMTKSLGGLTSFNKMMLVDPTVDAANPSRIAAAPTLSKATLQRIAKASANSKNLVELRDRDRLRAIIKEYVGKSSNKATSMKVVDMPELGTANAKVSISQGELPVQARMGAMVLRSDLEKVSVLQ